MYTKKPSPSMQRMQGMVDAVARGETNRSGLKQGVKTTPDLGLQEDGSTRYYHSSSGGGGSKTAGYGTVSKSGKLLTYNNSGSVSHTQDAKEIAHYIALRDAEAKKKEQQDFAREVQELNPTEKQKIEQERRNRPDTMESR
jgi:hypothetical protein